MFTDTSKNTTWVSSPTVIKWLANSFFQSSLVFLEYYAYFLFYGINFNKYA